MPGHAPTIVTLRPGLVTVVGADGAQADFAVTGGFVEISADSVSLLAERGHRREEITQEIFNEMMADAHRNRRSVEAKRDTAGDDVVTAAAKLLADMEALGTHIGLDPNHSNFPD
jgi:F-type H+-transporting ATPase subunit epsilon